MSWFFHGSGGENQLRISPSNLSPVGRPQCFVNLTEIKQNDNLRFDLFASLSSRCLISTAESDTGLFYGEDKIYQEYSRHWQAMLCRLKGNMLNDW